MFSYLEIPATTLYFVHIIEQDAVLFTTGPRGNVGASVETVVPVSRHRWRACIPFSLAHLELAAMFFCCDGVSRSQVPQARYEAAARPESPPKSSWVRGV